MKKGITRLLALALALVCALSACGGKVDKEPDEVKDAERLSTPADDPVKYLNAASEAAMADLKARYSGSPIAALSKLTGSSGNVTFDITLDEDGTQIGGNAGFDMEAKKLLLEAYMSYMGQRIDANLYFDQAYLGVSLPAVLGSDAYYGFATHDFYGQISNSFLSQYMEPEDLEAFRQVDDVLAALQGFDASSMEEYTDKLRPVFDEFVSSLEFQVTEEKVDVNGEPADGAVLRTTVDAEAMADLYSKIADIIYQSSLMTSLAQVSQITGEPAPDRTQIDEMIAQIRASGATLEQEYSIAGGKLVRLATVTSGEALEGPVNVTVDLYDGGAVTVTVESGGETATIVSSASSEKGAYLHTLTAQSGGETVIFATSWSDNHLDTTVETGGKTVLSLMGSFGVSADGFYLTDGALTVNPEEGASVTVPILFKYTSGGTVTTPSDMRNIFEMDESELMGLILNGYSAAGALN